jgi:hypothetical protein
MTVKRSRLLLSLLLGGLVLTAGVAAQRRGGGGGDQGKAVPRPPIVVRGEVFIGGYFYNPTWGPYPWWPRPLYPYRYAPVYDARASLRVAATPREAYVYVDGFYAGRVDDFDGTFQRLHLTPGGHELVLYLAGFRTERRHVYLGPGTSMTLRVALERLAPGEVSERPTFAPPLPPPPPGSFREPMRPPAVPPAEIVTAIPATAFGTLDLRVQPRGARVVVDDRVWVSTDPGHFVLELPPGTHRVQVTLDGYRPYATDVVIHDDEVTTLNVTLGKGL